MNDAVLDWVRTLFKDRQFVSIMAVINELRKQRDYWLQAYLDERGKMESFESWVKEDNEDLLSIGVEK